MQIVWGGTLLMSWNHPSYSELRVNMAVSAMEVFSLIKRYYVIAKCTNLEVEFKRLLYHLRVLRPWASYIIFLRLSFLYLENGHEIILHKNAVSITEFTFIKHPAHAPCCKHHLLSLGIISRKSSGFGFKQIWVWISALLLHDLVQVTHLSFNFSMKTITLCMKPLLVWTFLCCSGSMKGSSWRPLSKLPLTQGWRSSGYFWNPTSRPGPMVDCSGVSSWPCFLMLVFHLLSLWYLFVPPPITLHLTRTNKAQIPSVTRRVWADALAGRRAGIPLSEERKLRHPPVPLRLSWKCGHRLRKHWRQLHGKKLETLSMGKERGGVGPFSGFLARRQQAVGQVLMGWCWLLNFPLPISLASSSLSGALWASVNRGEDGLPGVLLTRSSPHCPDVQYGGHKLCAATGH